MTKAQRIEVANEALRICASHGRRFFSEDGDGRERMLNPRISHFELDQRGRLWFIDKWRGGRIYVSYDQPVREGWGRKFSDGGTLLSLCRALRDWILDERKTVPLGHFGPWPEYVCGGDLWGYGKEETQAVRRKIIELFNRREGTQ